MEEFSDFLFSFIFILNAMLLRSIGILITILIYVVSDFFNGSRSPTVGLQTNKNRARVSIGSGAFGVMLLSKKLTLPPDFARSGTCIYIYTYICMIFIYIYTNLYMHDIYIYHAILDT